MLVSTFELLVKSQLPRLDQIEPSPTAPPPDVLAKLQKLGRTVIQGYFLTLSNINFFDVTISLVFTALTPPVDIDETILFLDVQGINISGDLRRELVRGKARFTLTIPANDTALFLLQPDFIMKPELLTNPNFEVRGFVEIFISSLSGQNSAELLLTPEHRGTFYKDLDAADPQLDQIVYALPTASGGSLFRLSNS